MKNHPCFIIAEAGSNWRVGTPAKDWERARRLIDVAKSSGADAVKFQVFRGKTVYVPNAGSSDYLAKAGIKYSIQDIFKDMEMPYAMVPKIARYCKKAGIEFMASVFSIEDAKAVQPYVKRHKIASYEITHAELIAFLAGTSKPAILSTGGTNMEQVAWAVKWFYKNRGKDLSVLQCTAKYPTPFADLNLRVIPALAKKFRVAVGLSDHSLDPVIGPVAAVALGATIVEKHFTLSRKLKGPDHAFAVEPEELSQMVRAIRDCEAALGSEKKVVGKIEQELHEYAQRGIQAIRDIRKGEPIRPGFNVAILRPGKQRKGIHPKYLNDLIDRRAKRNIAIGDGIQKNDY